MSSSLGPPFSISFRCWSRFVATLVVTAFVMAAAGSPLQARDFFSSFFGGFFERRPPPPVQLPFATEFGDELNPAPRAPYGSGAAYCVRTCDGRYFPLSGSDSQANAAMCSNLCPASTTMVFYGNNIQNAYSKGTKSYSSLPNAFRYRNELVAGCTCNGKDPGGLAPIKAEDDPTLRKGDVVAGGSGNKFVLNNDSSRRGASVNYSRGLRSMQRDLVDRQ